MYNTVDDLNALLGVEAESISLEFKDGMKLQTFDDRVKKELVTDVTAFANAGGGTVIYGIREEKRHSHSVAAALSPVKNATITQDRLRETIISNTDPVFADFEIKAIPTPDGTVFVIKVEKGDTAYQNRIDRLYYSRVDASSVPMYGFAIRDVMNRRTAPNLVAQLRIHYDEMRPAQHTYSVIPFLSNKGLLTANHWTLTVGLPAALASIDNRADPHGTIRSLGEKKQSNGHSTQLYQFSSERQPPGSGGRLLPGESRELGMGEGYGLLRLSIGEQHQIRQTDAAPPLLWSLFVDNAPRHDGEMPFQDWCRW